MQTIIPPLSTLGAAAAAGVTITAMPKSPHSELASTDSASVFHASFPTAIVSQPFAVAISAPVFRPAAGGKKSLNPAGSYGISTPGVLQSGNAPCGSFLIAAVPPLCENKVVTESADLIAAVPPLCEIKVVTESADLNNTLVSKSADLEEMKTLIAAVHSLCTNKVVTESTDLAAPASAQSDNTGKSDPPELNANKEVTESSDLDGCAKESPSPRSPVSPYLDPSLWETVQKNSPNCKSLSNIGKIDDVIYGCT